MMSAATPTHSHTPGAFSHGGRNDRKRDAIGPDKVTAIAPLELVLCLLAFVFHIALAWGQPVPAGTEEHYLAAVAHSADPTFLSADFTFGTILPDRWFFDYLTARLLAITPLVTLAWIGRIATWTGTAIALLRLGRGLGLTAPLTTAALSLWVVYGQSLIGGEWLVGWFEAKAVAYVFIMWALVSLIDERLYVSAVLTGIAVTFHPAVGLTTAAAFLLTITVVYKLRPIQLTKVVLIGTTSALPGLIQFILMTTKMSSSNREDWEFLSSTFMQVHMDLASFSRQMIVVQGLVLLFNLSWTFANRRSRAHQALLCIQLAFLALTMLGAAAYGLGWYQAMGLMPFRLFPVFSLLTFFLGATAQIAISTRSRTTRRSIALVVVTALCLPPMLDEYSKAYSVQRKMWTQPEDDFRIAFRWVADNVSVDATGIVPPWRGDAALFGRRAQVVHFGMPRYDKLSEYRQRVEAAAGVRSTDFRTLRSRRWDETWNHWKEAFRRQSKQQLVTTAMRYGASFAVTDVEYELPVKFRSNNVRVYDLRRETEGK
jgi:hypothetical protein